MRPFKSLLTIYSTLSPAPHFRAALATLQKNATSFSLFLAAYLNGRYEHISPSIRPGLKSLLEPFFTEPRDAKKLIDRIIDIVRKGVRVEPAEMETLSKDLTVPLAEFLEALTRQLECLETEMDGIA